MATAKLSSRQKDIITQLICEEINQLKDDVEDSPESKKYLKDLKKLIPLFFDSNRVEIFTDN